MLWFVDHVTSTVKAQYIVTNAAGPASLHLMLVAEQFLASKATTIVELAVGQHSQHRALTRVNVPHHRHSTRPNKARFSTTATLQGQKNIVTFPTIANGPDQK